MKLIKHIFVNQKKDTLRLYFTDYFGSRYAANFDMSDKIDWKMVGGIVASVERKKAHLIKKGLTK